MRVIKGMEGMGPNVRDEFYDLSVVRRQRDDLTANGHLLPSRNCRKDGRIC